jgi:hypothetical protein
MNTQKKDYGEGEFQAPLCMVGVEYAYAWYMVGVKEACASDQITRCRC